MVIANRFCEDFKVYQRTSSIDLAGVLQDLSPLEHCDVESFINLADVVLTGQTTVLVAVNHQPAIALGVAGGAIKGCLLYTSPSPRDLSTSRMPSSA